MLIDIRKPSDVRSSEITPKSAYLDRRRFLQAAAVAGVIGSPLVPFPAAAARGAKLAGIVPTKWTAESLGETPTGYDVVTKYNNFYEFGTGKGDPAENAQDFQAKPWSVAVEGHVEKPGVYAYEDIVKPHKLEDRVYRFRCVEAWSMVVPWVGIPLADVIKRLGPTSKAKYVAFETLYDPARMPGQKRKVLPWPYREGLRLDEAMNPLTLLAVGLYGEELPGQNGAPIRLVVPWKYGFKSIKSIVKLTFTEEQPPTTWNDAISREYGFYSNVNPNVDHPRWSQAKERRLGGETNLFGFTPKIPTLMFNGYEEEVAGLYSGMDLAKNY